MSKEERLPKNISHGHSSKQRKLHTFSDWTTSTSCLHHSYRHCRPNSSFLSKRDGMSNSQLLRIELLTFSGRFTEWSYWKSTFKSDYKKYSFKSYLYYIILFKSSWSLVKQWEAFELIKNICISADYFETAWELLDSRYWNKRTVFSKHSQEIFAIAPIKQESAANLLTLDLRVLLIYLFLLKWSNLTHTTKLKLFAKKTVPTKLK